MRALNSIVLFVLFMLVTSVAHADYKYYRAITIAHGQVSTNDQTQFPILVCGNGASPCNASITGLNQSGGGAHVTNSNGYDIIFTKDSSCTSKLTWEMEKYVAASGEFVAWVTNTSTPLSHTTDTTFFMCYGNSAISSFQSTASSVWDSHYKGVWHMTSLTADSTTVNTGTVVGGVTTTTGKLGGAGTFNGTTGYIDVGNNASLNFTADATIEAWTKSTTVTASNKYIFTTGDNSGSLQMSLELGRTNGKFDYIAGVGATGFDILYSSGAAVANTYQHVVFARTGSGSSWTVKIYINGALDSTQSGTHAVSSLSKALIGAFRAAATQLFSGDLDEVRVSDSYRPVDWILTEYNNQSAPSSFYTMGSEAQVNNALFGAADF